jgi:uncharacterized protein YjdB
VTPETATIPVGASVQFSATIDWGARETEGCPKKQVDCSLSWHSSSSVASVDQESGLVFGSEPGTAIITARVRSITSQNPVEGVAMVEVLGGSQNSP